MIIVKIRELIKQLAKESLENKWYQIFKDEQKGYYIGDEKYESNCAFCRFNKYLYKYIHCSKCPIHKLPICESILMVQNLGDSTLIVEALEQLAENGEITKEMIQNLNDFRKEEMD